LQREKGTIQHVVLELWGGGGGEKKRKKDYLHEFPEVKNGGGETEQLWPGVGRGGKDTVSNFVQLKGGGGGRQKNELSLIMKKGGKHPNARGNKRKGAPPVL